MASAYIATPSPNSFLDTTNGPWTCVTSMNTPVRLHVNGDISCMSSNHHDCFWRNTQRECNAERNTNPSTIQPLVCGAMHKAEWGGNGYDTDGHWCNLLKRGSPGVAWQCVAGIDTPIRLNPNTGDVQCLSRNGRDCQWRSNHADCAAQLKAIPDYLQPLTCTSYDYANSNHWCRRGRVSLVSTGFWECIPGISTPVRVNAQGDVECLSTNHRDCAWQPDDRSCASFLAGYGGRNYGSSSSKLSVDPLICGANHRAEHYITGYDTYNHWCQRARTYYDRSRRGGYALESSVALQMTSKYIGEANEFVIVGAVSCLVAVIALVAQRRRAVKLPIQDADYVPLLSG